MRAGLRFYQVQAQVSCVTADGWDSSRQVPTMTVGAKDAHEAVRAVSDLAWLMSSGDYSNASERTTYATVVEMINGDNGDPIPLGTGSWVRVRYSIYGIETVGADTYGQLKAMA